MYKVALGLDPQLLYFDCFNAACAAVSFSEEGKNDERLSDSDCLELKRQAIKWLEQSLERYVVNFKTNPLAIKNALIVWKDDKDLVSVRDPDQMGHLDEPLRKSCESLWAKIDRLIEEMN